MASSQSSSTSTCGSPEQPSIFKNNFHHGRSFETLNVMREQRVLCDVTVRVGSREILAHRSALAAASPYFYAMFTGEMSESKQNVVNIKEVDACALEQLIEYCYTAEVKVTEENVQTLLPAANLLQLPDVRNACCEFLKTQLHPTNCLGIMRFADLHSCPDLVVAARSYIEQNFTDVLSSEEFMQLDCRRVVDFISSDQLTVPSEEKVYEAVRAWVYYSRVQREQHFQELMQHVRLPLLSRDYLVDRVETEPLMKKCSVCKDFLIEAMKYHLLPRAQRLLLQTPRTKSRTPGRPKILYVVGGQAPKAIRSVECYDIQGERWYNSTDMNLRRCRAGVAVCKGVIYAVGGFNGALRVRSVAAFDTKKNEWKGMASMEARRSTLGAAVLNDHLYSVGGFDGTTGLNTCEVYDPRNNEWQAIASMSIRRSSVGVGVLKGFLYAVGGYDGNSRQCLSSVERYDPAANVWEHVADMTVKRSGAGVGVLGDFLYAVGGHDGPLVRKSVEYYNPDTNKWTIVSDMSLARRNAGVASIDGLLYVVGGDDGSINLSTVEVYSSRTDKWDLLPSQMSTGRSYAGVVVLDKPFNR
uniref:BTB domain-containing protein n=2 Tax=Clytia hemisphaerica TaxID=252671 RepID=A0A7M5WW90_9CNID|eukprot:TCONS_00013969-protein